MGMRRKLWWKSDGKNFENWNLTVIEFNTWISTFLFQIWILMAYLLIVGNAIFKLHLKIITNFKVNCTSGTFNCLNRHKMWLHEPVGVTLNEFLQRTIKMKLRKMKSWFSYSKFHHKTRQFGRVLVSYHDNL